MALMRRQQQTPARRSAPFGPLARLRNEIDRLFESPFEFGLGDLLEGNWVPPVDVKDNGDHVLVKAELPGMKPEEIQLSVRENTLTISGERREQEEQREGEIYSGRRDISDAFSARLRFRKPWIRIRFRPPTGMAFSR